jgi:hypothetical protein
MNNELKRLPQFTISQIELKDTVHCHGVFDTVIRLGDGWISFLVNPEGGCIEGRFYQFDVNTRTAIFKPKENQLPPLESGKSYAYLDGYWGERVALVMDNSRSWNRLSFIAQDAMAYKSGDKSIVGKVGQSPEFPVEGSGKKIRKGWDHEHCAICWETIDEDEHPFGYTDQNDEWVCEVCYSNYVQPRRLGFLDDTALSQIRGERK